MTQKIVIIGNGPAGISVAGAARLADRTAEIIVIDTKDYDTFHPCAMPFVIGGYLHAVDAIIERLNYEANKIRLYKNSFVDTVDTQSQTLLVKDKKTGDEFTLTYDKLVLCTGSKVFIPPIPGKELKNVFSLKFAEDAKAIKEAINTSGVKQVVVVGGSAIGIEVASEIRHLGKEIMIIEMQPQLMPFKISKGFAELVEAKLINTGIMINTQMVVKEIIGKEKVEKIRFGNEMTEKEMNADVIILATGVRPNIELAQKIGVRINEQFKAIEVNEAMETNIPGIFAAGDCVAVTNLVTKSAGLALLAGPAVRQGRVAGTNAAGGNLSYPGSINSSIVSSRTFFVGLAGINEEQASELGLETITAKLSANIRPHYMPTSKEITIKLIAQTADGKLLGGEVIGEENVDVNVNYIALALQMGLTVYDLMNIDFCYAPAVSETIYPLVKVADALIRKLDRKKTRGSS